MRTKVNERRAQFAAAIIEAGIDLNTDFFALPHTDLTKLADLAKVFKYKKPANYPGCLARAFYYTAQRAYYRSLRG